jgi:hypothetical protein
MQTKNTTKITADEGKQELFIVREFDAPRELVFQAFNEPDLLLQWLGPKDMEMKIDRMDNRTGGSYRFVHSYAGGGLEFGSSGPSSLKGFPNADMCRWNFLRSPNCLATGRACTFNLCLNRWRTGMA